MFSNEKKVNAKAKAYFDPKLAIHLLWLSLPPLMRENEKWNVKVFLLQKGHLGAKQSGSEEKAFLCS